MSTSNYVPRSGVLIPRPQERVTTPDEDRILHFLAHGIHGNVDKIAEARREHRYVTAAEAQLAANLLASLRDAIRAGLHDENHPARAIDPVEQARLHLAGMSRSRS